MKEFFKLTLKIYIFLNIVYFLPSPWGLGGFGSVYTLEENIYRYVVGNILSAFLFSSIYLFFIRPIWGFLSKQFNEKFVAEDEGLSKDDTNEIFREVLGMKKKK